MSGNKLELLTDEQIIALADKWNVASETARYRLVDTQLIEFARALLDTPTASKTTEQMAGAHEDLAIWKKRALNAEDLLRIERDITKRLCAELNDANGPTFMGEPVATSKADTGEAIRNVILEEKMREFVVAFDTWRNGGVASVYPLFNEIKAILAATTSTIKAENE